MTTSTLFVAAFAGAAAFATPAFAQWESRAPAAFEAHYPNVNRNLSSAVTRGSMVDAPSATSPGPTVIRTTKGN